MYELRGRDEQPMQQPGVRAAIGRTAISIQEVSKIYRSVRGDDVLALDRISLQVGRGEFVALLGPSGCGKSTLLSIVAGLSDATGGDVAVGDSPPRPGRNVGMMFQRSLMFPWRTVLRNVLLPGELMGIPKAEAKDRAEELLELVGLAGWGKRFPWELSGGMQQRAALARVLLPNPDLLLLDEPFGALDEMTRETLDVEFMRITAPAEKTVVFVTHNVYEAVLMADRVCVFTKRPGRVEGIVDVEFPRPRSIELSGSPEFAEKVGEARELLKAATQ